jgi:hypothetical protein
VTEPGETDVRQLPTHNSLVTALGAPGPLAFPPATLDAIIVPASRSAESLTTAVALAKAIECRLVILCSFQARPAAVRRLFNAHSLPLATAVLVPPGYHHPLLDFATTDWSREGDGRRICAERNSDLSSKRNIGLLLARMLGWNRIFFMDDDIREIHADAILDTVSLLGVDRPDEHGVRYRTAGMMVHDFPDNSVVCHARRAINDYQDVFVSGSVLAVDTKAPFGFFPDIYNEDWLFFYHDAAAKRLASSSSKVQQLRYDPFGDPQRAASQEFGDVIAEGLYTLLHAGRGIESADEQYWTAFLGDRSRILEQVMRRSYEAESEVRQKMVKAVTAAQKQLHEIKPDMCVNYTDAWHGDLEQWRRRLETLPSPGSVAKALKELDLQS